MIAGKALRHLANEVFPSPDGKLPSGVKINHSSVDVSLGNQFEVPSVVSPVDLSDPPAEWMLFDTVSRPRHDDPFILKPGGFVKAYLSAEMRMSRNVSAMFSLRSSMAQLGLEQSTSVWVRPGWEGYLVLELTNVAPWDLLLRPGLEVGQFHFFKGDNAPISDD